MIQTLLLVLLFITIACQEEKSEVLRQGKKTAPPPSHIYGDVTTIDIDDKSPTRFVFRITHDHNNKITEVLVRSVDLNGNPHEDSSSGGVGCIDKFSEPNHRVDKKSKMNVIQKNKNTGSSNVWFQIIISKGKLNGDVTGFSYDYKTNEYHTRYRFKSKDGKAHETTNNISDYFMTGNGVEFCEDESPSGSETPSPQ